MPFQSSTTAAFRRLLAALPRDVQAQAAAAFARFLTDPFDPSLALKRLQGSATLYSARVGLHYRALARRDGSRFDWFWIGSHAEYDRLIRRSR
jgi:hypothetical protein